MTFSEAQRGAIEQLFSYAEHHANKLQEELSPDEFQWVLDHYMMMLVAAVQNIFKVLDKKIHCPSVQTLENVPELNDVIWVWEARNHVAHHYFKWSLPIHTDIEFELDVPFSLDDGTWTVSERRVIFQDIEMEGSKNYIPAPQKEPYVLASNVLNFWKSTFRYVLTHEKNSYTYKTLWEYHCTQNLPLTPIS